MFRIEAACYSERFQIDKRAISKSEGLGFSRVGRAHFRQRQCLRVQYLFCRPDKGIPGRRDARPFVRVDKKLHIDALLQRFDAVAERLAVKDAGGWRPGGGLATEISGSTLAKNPSDTA